MQALCQLACGQGLRAAAVLVGVALLQLLLHLCAQVGQVFHARHDGLCPRVIGDGRLHVDDALHRDGRLVEVHDGITVLVGFHLRTFEGKGLRLAHLHANHGGVEIVGHGKRPRVVFASVRAQRLHPLAVHGSLHGQLNLVAAHHRVVGLVGHGHGGCLRHLGNLLVDLGAFHRRAGQRDRHRAIVVEGKLGHGHADHVVGKSACLARVLQAFVDGCADGIDAGGGQGEGHAVAHDALVEGEGGLVSAHVPAQEIDRLVLGEVCLVVVARYLVGGDLGHLLGAFLCVEGDRKLQLPVFFTHSFDLHRFLAPPSLRVSAARACSRSRGPLCPLPVLLPALAAMRLRRACHPRRPRARWRSPRCGA